MEQIHFSAPKYTILIGQLILIILCLASCGEGAESDTPLLSTSSSAVSGSSSSSSLNMEVINGITVPPEPNPIKNAATIQGVDVNTNGVRDDIERKIAVDSESITQFKAMSEIIVEIENIVNGKSTSRGKLDCLLNKYNEYADFMLNNQYDTLIFNSTERKNLFISSNVILSLDTGTCNE